MTNGVKKTVTISIGNSDNKLSQKGWSCFCEAIKYQILCCSVTIHFEGYTNPNSEYQSATWIASVEDFYIDRLKEYLTWVRKGYKQDSVAITIGDTEFI